MRQEKHGVHLLALVLIATTKLGISSLAEIFHEVISALGVGNKLTSRDRDRGCLHHLSKSNGGGTVAHKNCYALPCEPASFATDERNKVQDVQVSVHNYVSPGIGLEFSLCRRPTSYTPDQ
jgi:hypothetical protein